MDQTSQWRSSTTATYRLPLWWPRDAVVLPSVPKEDRDQVIRRATSRVRSTVTAYPTRASDVTA